MTGVDDPAKLSKAGWPIRKTPSLTVLQAADLSSMSDRGHRDAPCTEGVQANAHRDDDGERQAVSGTVEARTLLVQFLREQLGLTGTHVGCDTSQCGACVVHVDGKSVKILHHAGRAGRGRQGDHHRGLGQNGELHPMQAAPSARIMGCNAASARPAW